MPLFDNLIAELVRDDLIDDSVKLKRDPIQSPPDRHLDSPESLAESRVDLLTHSAKSKLKSSESFDVSVLNVKTDQFSENVFPFEEKPKVDTSVKSLPLISKQDLLKASKKRRKVNKKIKSIGNYCSSCEVKLSRFFIYCPFCHNRVIGSFYFYSTLLLLFLGLIWLIFS